MDIYLIGTFALPSKAFMIVIDKKQHPYKIIQCIGKSYRIETSFIENARISTNLFDRLIRNCTRISGKESQHFQTLQKPSLFVRVMGSGS